MDAIKDLSTLTSIPYSNILKVCETIENIICHDVKESMYESGADSITEIDIGIGKLTIYYTESEIRYYFVPCNSLEQKLININDNDTLVSKLEDSLTDKIISSYKNVF